jgi:hypothetical protein
LIAEEDPADGEKGQVSQPKQDQDGHREQANHEAHGQHDSGPADAQHKRIAGIEPTYRRDAPESASPESPASGQEFAGRKNPLAAHQALQLKGQREKRRKIDYTQQPQEQPASQRVAVGRWQLQGRRAHPRH